MAFSILSSVSSLLGLSEPQSQVASDVKDHKQHITAKHEPCDAAEACACRTDPSSESAAACCKVFSELSPAPPEPVAAASPAVQGRLLYASESGNTRQIAAQLALSASQAGCALCATDLAEYETENLCKERIVVCMISTHQGGAPPESAR